MIVANNSEILTAADEEVSGAAVSFNGNVKLSKTKYVYDGKKKTPGVIVADKSGFEVPESNYTVAYQAGRTSIGRYAVKITFKKKYKGSKTLYFEIVPKESQILSLTAGDKKVTVRYKKPTGDISGYQVQYSTNKSFSPDAKSINIDGASKVSTTISGISSGKTYYVRVRTYKRAGGRIIYSNWSSYKSVKGKSDDDNTIVDNSVSLDIDVALDKFSVYGKPLKNWTVKSMKEFLQEKAGYTESGKMDNGDYATTYNSYIGPCSYGVLYDNPKYLGASLTYSSKGTMDIDEYFTGKKVYYIDFWPNTNNLGWTIGGNHYKLYDLDINHAECISNGLRHALETIYPGMYAKIAEGKIYKGKNFKAYLDGEDKSTIIVSFTNSNEIEIGQNDDKVWIRITKK